MVSPGQKVSLDIQEDQEQTGLLDPLLGLEVPEPKVYLDPLVWMVLMASLDLKASQEHQVGTLEVVQELPVFPV